MRSCMFAKRFLFVSLGLLCLVLAYSIGATRATAKPPGTLSDVAVLTGVLNDGEMIPLPVYSDGAPAVESDCRWTVSMNRGDLPNLPMQMSCYTDGRVVRASTCDTQNGVCTSTHPGKANYMIIAIRH